MDKEDMLHMYNGILYSTPPPKKNEIMPLASNMGTTGGYHAK